MPVTFTCLKSAANQQESSCFDLTTYVCVVSLLDMFILYEYLYNTVDGRIIDALYVSGTDVVEHVSMIPGFIRSLHQP